MVLIQNKQDAVVFKETLKFDGHTKRLWKDFFLGSKFMSICSSSQSGSQHRRWRMLSNTCAQKAWRSMNQEVTGRQWMFLPVCQAVRSDVYWRSTWRRASYRVALAGSERPEWESPRGRSTGETCVQECPKWGTGRWRAEETCATWQELLSRGGANNRSFGDNCGDRRKGQGQKSVRRKIIWQNGGR